jgi:hypothetical protein
MFEAAKWEMNPEDISNAGYEKLRQTKIAQMTAEEKQAWNDLVQFIAREVSTVAVDLMLTKSRLSHSDYADAYDAAIKRLSVDLTLDEILASRGTDVIRLPDWVPIEAADKSKVLAVADADTIRDIERLGYREKFRTGPLHDVEMVMLVDPKKTIGERHWFTFAMTARFNGNQHTRVIFRRSELNAHRPIEKQMLSAAKAIIGIWGADVVRRSDKWVKG